MGEGPCHQEVHSVKLDRRHEGQKIHVMSEQTFSFTAEDVSIYAIHFF